MNTERMEQLAASIVSEPRKLNMAEWGYIIDLSKLTEIDPPCGTVGCLAGNTVALFDPRVIDQARQVLVGNTFPRTFNFGFSDALFSVPERAKQLLDLTRPQAVGLFFIEGWPAEFQEKYVNAKGDKRLQAEAAAARLRYMSETGA